MRISTEQDHLKTLGYPGGTPLVIQREMGAGNDLDTGDLPSITANFASGEGVMATLEAISKLVLNDFKKNKKT